MELVNHYRWFLPIKYNDEAEPLYKMLQDDASYNWTSAENDVFESIKEMLVKPPVLAFFNPTCEAFVRSDACHTGLGAELSHKQPNGHIQPVASRTLTEAEQKWKYSTNELEALACVYAVEQSDHYLAVKRLSSAAMVLTNHYLFDYLDGHTDK